MAATKDAIALLKADHRKVEELFEKYQTSGPRRPKLPSTFAWNLRSTP
jgi:hypothetical protein